MNMAKIKIEHYNLKQNEPIHRNIQQLLIMVIQGEGNKLVFVNLYNSYHKMWVMHLQSQIFPVGKEHSKT